MLTNQRTSSSERSTYLFRISNPLLNDYPSSIRVGRQHSTSQVQLSSSSSQQPAFPNEQKLSADQIREFLHESHQTTNSRQSSDFTETLLNPQKLEKIILKQTFLETNHLFDPSVYFGGLQVEDLNMKINDARLVEMFQTNQQSPFYHTTTPTTTGPQPLTPILQKSTSTIALLDLTNNLKKHGKPSPSPIPSKRKPITPSDCSPYSTNKTVKPTNNTQHSQQQQRTAKTPLKYQQQQPMKPSTSSSSISFPKKSQIETLTNKENNFTSTTATTSIKPVNKLLQHSQSQHSAHFAFNSIKIQPTTEDNNNNNNNLPLHNNSTQSKQLKDSITSFSSNSIYNQMQLLQAIQSIESTKSLAPNKPQTDTTSSVYSYKCTNKPSNNDQLQQQHPQVAQINMTAAIAQQQQQQQQQHVQAQFNHQSSSYSNDISIDHSEQQQEHNQQQKQQQLESSQLLSKRLLQKQQSMSRMFEQKLTSEQFFKDKENLELTFQDDDDDDSLDELPDEQMIQNSSSSNGNNNNNNNNMHQYHTKNNNSIQHAHLLPAEDSIVTFSKLLPTFQNEQSIDMLPPSPHQHTASVKQPATSTTPVIVPRLDVKSIHKKPSSIPYLGQARNPVNQVPSSSSRLRKSSSQKTTLLSSALTDNSTTEKSLCAQTSRSKKASFHLAKPSSGSNYMFLAAAAAAAADNNNSLKPPHQSTSRTTNLIQPLSAIRQQNSPRSLSNNARNNHHNISVNATTSISKQHQQSSQQPLSNQINSLHNTSSSTHNKSTKRSALNSNASTLALSQHINNNNNINNSSNYNTNSNQTSAYLRRPEGKGSFDYKWIPGSFPERGSNNSSNTASNSQIKQGQPPQTKRVASPDLSPSNYKLKPSILQQQLNPNASLRTKKMQHRLNSNLMNAPKYNESSTYSIPTGPSCSSASSVKLLSNTSIQSNQFSTLQLLQQQQPYQLASQQQQQSDHFQSGFANTSLCNPTHHTSIQHELKRSPSALFSVDMKYDAILSHFMKMSTTGNNINTFGGTLPVKPTTTTTTTTTTTSRISPAGPSLHDSIN